MRHPVEFQSSPDDKSVVQASIKVGTDTILIDRSDDGQARIVKTDKNNLQTFVSVHEASGISILAQEKKDAPIEVVDLDEKSKQMVKDAVANILSPDADGKSRLNLREAKDAELILSAAFKASNKINSR